MRGKVGGFLRCAEKIEAGPQEDHVTQLNDLTNASVKLSTINRLLKYSPRKRKAMLGEFDFSDLLFGF